MEVEPVTGGPNPVVGLLDAYGLSGADIVLKYYLGSGYSGDVHEGVSRADSRSGGGSVKPPPMHAVGKAASSVNRVDGATESSPPMLDAFGNAQPPPLKSMTTATATATAPVVAVPVLSESDIASKEKKGIVRRIASDIAKRTGLRKNSKKDAAAWKEGVLLEKDREAAYRLGAIGGDPAESAAAGCNFVTDDQEGAAYEAMVAAEDDRLLQEVLDRSLESVNRVLSAKVSKDLADGTATASFQAKHADQGEHAHAPSSSVRAVSSSTSSSRSSTKEQGNGGGSDEDLTRAIAMSAREAEAAAATRMAAYGNKYGRSGNNEGAEESESLAAAILLSEADDEGEHSLDVLRRRQHWHDTRGDEALARRISSGGEETEVPLSSASKSASKPAESKSTSFERWFRLGDQTPFGIEPIQDPESGELLVTEVDPNGQAARAGVQVGARVAAVEGKSIPNGHSKISSSSSSQGGSSSGALDSDGPDGGAKVATRAFLEMVQQARRQRQEYVRILSSLQQKQQPRPPSPSRH